MGSETRASTSRKASAPWYARTGVTVAAAIAAVAGAVLLVIGVVGLAGNAGEREDAANTEEEAAGVEADARDLRQDAEGLREKISALPGLMDELDLRTDEFLAVVESQALQWNAFTDCLSDAPDVIPDPELAACFDQHLEAFEEGTREGDDAVQRLRDGLTQAEEPVAAAEDVRDE